MHTNTEMLFPSKWFRPLLAILVLGLVAPILAYAAENADFLRGKAIYQHGKGNPAEFPSALASLKNAAEAGHAESQFLVGRMYEFGHGVAVDLGQAEHWYHRAADNGNALAWNNLGFVYEGLGRKTEEIMGCFLRSSELGYAGASYNVAQTSRLGLHGAQKDYVRALEYYRKTLDQQPDYPEAWNGIGLVYENGGFGVEEDLKAAEAAYLNGVRVTQDKYCYYNLYNLYESGRLPESHGPATDYLEKAAEHGHAVAAARVGEKYRLGRGCNPDLVKSVHFLDIAAREKNGWCIRFLGDNADNKQLVKAYGLEVTGRWKSRLETFRKAAQREVADALVGVRSAFDAGDEAAAETALNAALERWKGRTVDAFYYEHTHVLWSEAQVKSGREYAEWGRFLFSWQVKIYEGDEQSLSILAARDNLNELLIETGRYGQLRESCTVIKRLFRELEGFNFDAVRRDVSVAADYRIIGAESLPVVVDVDEAMRSRRLAYEMAPSAGEPIGGQAMSAMRWLAGERLSIGDWKSVLVVAEWLERWVRQVKSTGMYPPRAYPGCLGLLEQTSGELRAEAFSALGLPQQEAEAWRSIIEMGYKDSYGGKLLHKAQYRLAVVRVEQGAKDLDAAALKEVEDQMRKNIYEDGGEWLYAKLVRARVLAGSGESAAGMALADEVLGASVEKKLPLLRLESLLTAAGLKLDSGKADGVEAWLEEALTWARGKGLLPKELRIYEVYVRYLIFNGDYAQALEMQHRVLDLIDALNLAPRLARANIRLAEIYGLRHEATAARALLAEIKDPGLVGEIRKLTVDLNRGENHSAAEDVASSELIDLQPLGIQSMPLQNEAEAIFILTNPNPESRRVEMKFNSARFGLVVERATRDEIALRCETAAGEGKPNVAVTIEVPGKRLLPVTLTARGPGATGTEAAIALQAQIVGSSMVRKSEWKILPDASEAHVAVVDAARLRNNPFCLMPVYHHLNAAKDQAAAVALRVVASEPTRVEGFAADGTLLFVDAQGNGSFGDPGDIIATNDIRDRFPLLATGNDRDRIALRYAPESLCANGRVEIKIETQVIGGDGSWISNAVDWLEP